MALTSTETNQLKTAGYTDAQIAVMTDREARQKIAALGGTVEGSTAGGSGLPAGGAPSWLDGLFGMFGELGKAGFGFGSAVVSTQNGFPAPNNQPVQPNQTGFFPQIFTPEQRSNTVWYVLGGLLAVAVVVGLFFAFRKK